METSQIKSTPKGLPIRSDSPLEVTGHERLKFSNRPSDSFQRQRRPSWTPQEYYEQAVLALSEDAGWKAYVNHAENRNRQEIVSDAEEFTLAILSRQNLVRNIDLNSSTYTCVLHTPHGPSAADASENSASQESDTTVKHPNDTTSATDTTIHPPSACTFGAADHEVESSQLVNAADHAVAASLIELLNAIARTCGSKGRRRWVPMTSDIKHDHESCPYKYHTRVDGALSAALPGLEPISPMLAIIHATAAKREAIEQNLKRGEVELMAAFLSFRFLPNVDKLKPDDVMGGLLITQNFDEIYLTYSRCRRDYILYLAKKLPFDQAGSACLSRYGPFSIYKREDLLILGPILMAYMLAKGEQKTSTAEKNMWYDVDTFKIEDVKQYNQFPSDSFGLHLLPLPDPISIPSPCVTDDDALIFEEPEVPDYPECVEDDDIEDNPKIFVKNPYVVNTTFSDDDDDDDDNDDPMDIDEPCVAPNPLLLKLTQEKAPLGSWSDLDEE